jgi:hypothetical protein
MEAVRVDIDALSLFAGIGGQKPQYRTFAGSLLSSQFRNFTG